MAKKIKNVILNHIPEYLQNKIILNNVSKIIILQNKNPNMFISSFVN